MPAFRNPPLVNGGLYRAVSSSGLIEEAMLVGVSYLHDGTARGTLHRAAFAPETRSADDQFFSRWELYDVPSSMSAETLDKLARAAGFEAGALPLRGSHYAREAEVRRLAEDLKNLRNSLAV